jgi:hypothetical protein
MDERGGAAKGARPSLSISDAFAIASGNEWTMGRPTGWVVARGRKKEVRRRTESRPVPSHTPGHLDGLVRLSLVAKRRPWWAATITGRFHWQRTLEGRHGALQRYSGAPAVNPCFEITRMRTTILVKMEVEGTRSKRNAEQTGHTYACLAGKVLRSMSRIAIEKSRRARSGESVHHPLVPASDGPSLPVLLQSTCSTLQASNEPAGATLPCDTNAQISRKVVNRGFL